MLMLTQSFGTATSRVLIRHAGLEESQERRIRIASRLLSVYGIKASVEPWDGTRCTLLVVTAGDVIGERAVQLAQRRHTPVLVIGGGGVPDAGMFHVAEGAPSAMILEVLRTILGVSGGLPVASGPETASGDVLDACALVRLADHASGSGGDLFARVGSTDIKFRWSSGRVVAATHSDLLHARDRLGQAQWSIRPLDPNRRSKAPGEVSASIDVFFLRGALSPHAKTLPAFPAGRFQLADWPDLGSAPDLVQSLALAGHLIRHPATAAEAAKATGMPLELVERSFWGFRAAGLLAESGGARSGATGEAKLPAKPGVWKKLAARFGLLRGSD